MPCISGLALRQCCGAARCCAARRCRAAQGWMTCTSCTCGPASALPLQQATQPHACCCCTVVSGSTAHHSTLCRPCVVTLPCEPHPAVAACKGSVNLWWLHARVACCHGAAGCRDSHGSCWRPPRTSPPASLGTSGAPQRPSEVQVGTRICWHPNLARVHAPCMTCQPQLLWLPTHPSSPADEDGCCAWRGCHGRAPGPAQCPPLYGHMHRMPWAAQELGC